MLPLYFREDQFGYILIEYGPSNKLIYETLRSQISSSIKGALLLKARQSAEIKLRKAFSNLEDINKDLHNLSHMDELTGLLNRRGFVNMGKRHIELAKARNVPFLLFFADLDGLKEINDTFGHKEGDFAIIKTGEILKKSLRQTDIISRLGGDEFTFITINTSRKNANIIKQNIILNMKEYNHSSDKPYKLSISIGMAYYSPDLNITFKALMEIADKMLYNEKKSKK